jgi:putative endonuclease
VRDLLMNNREIGANGEDIACEYLIKNGYKILERNKHFSKLCEIDIIAQYKDVTIFIEVKTRKNNSFGSPLEAITKSKYKNIKTGVYNYVLENNIKNFQIDVIGITQHPVLDIKHIKNV